MPQIIHLLDDTTVNQIAAGEVIEDPASVIKELIENSLDAGATEIEIEVTKAGRQLIRVSDNGAGMSKEDAQVATKRHATSKLRAVSDLEQIASFGFRGEALASIASISRFRLRTAQEEPIAFQVEIEGGKEISCGAEKRKKGTCIEVRSLFFNQPVRQKFMKSIKRDQNEILKTINSLCLANPQVSFHFIQDGKTLIKRVSRKEKSFEENFIERVEEALGTEILIIDEREGPCRIFGAIAKAHLSRKTRSNQELFISQRKIHCPELAYAIKDGYGATLQEKHYPIFALHLFAPAPWLDVNVHPQKKHLRLLEEKFLKDFFKKAVEKTIFSPKSSFQIDHGPNLIEELPWESKSHEQKAPLKEQNYDFKKLENMQTNVQTWKQISNSSNKDQSLEPKENKTWLKENIHFEVLFTDPNYIYCKKNSSHGMSELCIVNQKAAQRRLFFDQFEIPIQELQELIVPLCLEFTQKEANFLEKELETLKACGIILRPFGQRSLVLEALPVSLKKEQIREILISWAENPSKAILEEKKQQLAKTACRSIRSQKLCLEEAQHLLNSLLKSEKSQHCPLGKKIMHCLSLEQVDEFFQ